MSPAPSWPKIPLPQQYADARGVQPAAVVHAGGDRYESFGHRNLLRSSKPRTRYRGAELPVELSPQQYACDGASSVITHVWL